MALTICEHCGQQIWVGTDGLSLENHDRLVHAPKGPPDYGRITGVKCPSCEKVHNAPPLDEEDWFE